MAFFSFSLLKEPFEYLSTKIEPNKKYYSKDIALSKELNNKNKINSFAKVIYEKRLNITNIGKKILICLPPKFGVGDAIEYGIAIYSIIQLKKFRLRHRRRKRRGEHFDFARCSVQSLMK